MDARTAEAVDTLRAEIRQIEASLSGDIGKVEASLRSELGDLGSSLRIEMHDVRTEVHGLKTEMHDLRTEMHGLNDDTKRHMNVIAESLRGDIRMIAEGVVALSAKVDSLRQ
jgi:hypothetical protein